MKIQTPCIYIQLLEGAFVCPRSFHDGVSKREATMGFLTTFYKYIIQQYFTVTAPHSMFSQYLKQIKYQMLVVVHPPSDENVRLQWGF